jgi:hypothetical protein
MKSLRKVPAVLFPSTDVKSAGPPDTIGIRSPRTLNQGFVAYDVRQRDSTDWARSLMVMMGFLQNERVSSQMVRLKVKSSPTQASARL